ncbi:MAG: hypothetical protein JWQ81_8544 [Amycolatopsis sp.]|uniref:hypothetical protein n=1 Tax=Amycolatopsis sp. TaxID=37632 RepID=UPI002602E39B|nr:hypothetical protein [Amycolatopsis sp.]MCU1687805.1 hypothetical protein [Amycolatopsis sp.]
MTSKEPRGHLQTSIVQAVDLAGRPLPVTVAVLDTAGGLQIALRVDEGVEVILPDHASIELSVQLQQAFAAKLKGGK